MVRERWHRGLLLLGIGVVTLALIGFAMAIHITSPCDPNPSFNLRGTIADCSVSTQR